MKYKTLSILICTIIVFTSCKKNTTSNSPTINYQLTTANRTSVITRTASGSLQWLSGFGSATQIKFEAKNGTNQVEYTSPAVQKIDLFTSVASTFSNVSLPSATYTEVEFRIELNPTSTDAALELDGQYTSGSGTIPVTFKVTTPFEIKSEKNNVVVTDKTAFKALTTIDLTLITRGVTQTMLDNAIRTSGVIVLSSTSNTTIYNLILNNLSTSEGVEFDHD